MQHTYLFCDSLLYKHGWGRGGGGGWGAQVVQIRADGGLFIL